MIPQTAQTPEPEQKNLISRRAVFFKVGLLLNGLAALVLATPVIGYLMSPILAAKEKGGYKRWITLGELDEFPENQTRLAKFANPITGVSDGKTDDIPCWVRRLSGENSRSSPSTARTWDARCAGSRSQACSCVLVTAACTTRMARALPARLSVDYSNTPTKW